MATHRRAENLNLPRICISTPFIVSYWSDFNALVYLTKASSRLATDKIIIGRIPLGVKSLPLKILCPKKGYFQIQISALIQTTYCVQFQRMQFNLITSFSAFSSSPMCIILCVFTHSYFKSDNEFQSTTE